MPATNVHLNVLFHGLFVFVDRPNGIEVLIPDMGADHVYRAGEWLGETTLARGSYELSGVAGQGGKFDPAVNLIVQNFEPSQDDEGVYARISLPRPNQIISLRQVTLTPACLTETVAGTIRSRTVSAVQVFTYDIPDQEPASVALGDHVFTTSAQPIGDEFFMSLHIIAGPDHAEQREHILMGFDSAVNLVPDLVGNLKLTCNPKVPRLTDQKLVPPGCILEEFLDLSARTDKLAYYGRHIREVLSVDPKAVPPAWSELAGVADDVHTCTGLVTQISGTSAKGKQDGNN